MASRIDRVIKLDGVVAIHAVEHGTRVALRGGPLEHDAMLSAACSFLRDLHEPGAVEQAYITRITLAKQSVFVERTGGWIVAVMLETGHRVGKSIPRSLRRMFSALRPSLPHEIEVSERIATTSPSSATAASIDDSLPFSPMRRLIQRDDYDTV